MSGCFVQERRIPVKVRPLVLYRKGEAAGQAEIRRESSQLQVGEAGGQGTTFLLLGFQLPSLFPVCHILQAEGKA